MMAVLQDALTLVNTGRDSGLGARDSGLANRGCDRNAGSSVPSRRAGHQGSRAPSPESRAPSPDSSTSPTCPPTIPAVYQMLQEADTIGIFQVESRAQMATLPRLRPQRFYDIVVEVAIIRPGPIVGQMVHPYLKRRQGLEPVVYPHPSLEPILKRTLGVPLFQEQLLRMAMVAAGFSGGEAEELRRAMGFKRSEKRMQQIEGRLRSGMARQGIVGEPAEEIIRSITSFALYGFPESHAASFALARLRQRLPEGALSGGVLTPRSSTTSRWASIIRRRWSRMRSATASGFCPSTCRYPTGNAASSRTAGSGSV